MVFSHTFAAMMRGVMLLLFTVRLLTAQTPDFLNWQQNPGCMKWVDSVYGALDTNQRIAQCFMLPAYTTGEEYNMPQVFRLIADGKAGGVIFFKGKAEDQAAWTNKLNDSAKLPPFVAIDGEWGVAMRITNATALPKQLTMGAVQNDSLIFEMAQEIGRQCRRMGIHINFAPVVDVNNNLQNPVIGDRSFGEDKYKVAVKGLYYVEGQQSQGVLACAKHFPGHGDTDKDSHLELPSLIRGLSRLRDLEFYPFKMLFNNGVGSAMVAHLNVPALDTAAGSVASLSRRVTTNWLKDSLQFRGLVFSDALNMKGVSLKYPPGTVDSMAFVAGNDILVFSNDCEKGAQKIKAALVNGTLSGQEFETRVKKVLAYKYLLGVHRPQKIDVSSVSDDLNSPRVRELRAQLYENAITFAGDRENLLPLRNPQEFKIASLSIATRGITSFQQTIGQFAQMDFFTMLNDQSITDFRWLIDTLAHYDLVIVDVHGMSRFSTRNFGVSDATSNFIAELSAIDKVIVAVFGSPYALCNFQSAQAVIAAYEDNDATQLAAANALFGGIAVTGKLPVTSCEVFKAGMGETHAQPIRLKFSWPEREGLDASYLRDVDDIVLKGILNRAMPGCQVLVAKDNAVVLNKSYGNFDYESRQSVRTETIYDLASVTKVAATTLAVMKLFEDEKLKLKHCVDDYLKLPRGSHIDNLRIGDLLLHQAGLKAFIPFYKNTIGDEAAKYYRKEKSKRFSVRVADSLFIRTDYPDSMWHQMALSEVNKKPGYLYSDMDFYILQKVVEEVSEMPLDSFVKKHFYEPMGLTRTAFNPLNNFGLHQIPPTQVDSEFRKQTVRGYVNDPGAAMYGGVAGHAGLFSNAFDLAQIFQMLLNGGSYNGHQLLQPETIEYFTRKQSHISRRGLGFDKPEPDPSKSSPCSDNTPLSAFGHTGFTGTCVWADPENNMTYVFLSNRTFPDAENNQLLKMNIRSDIQRAVYKSLKK